MAGVILRIRRTAGLTDYEVDPTPGMTILDALEVIRQTREPGLRYRHSCHHGACGTCAGLVNGRERLLCITPLRDAGPSPVVLEPLRKAILVGDLATDPSRFFSEMPRGTSYLRPSRRKPAEPGDPALPPAADRNPSVELDACIECGICVSACPVTAPFVGPAALAAVDSDREADPRREDGALAFAANPRGVEACESAFECSRACPQGVAPGRRITALRRSLRERTRRPEKPSGD